MKPSESSKVAAYISAAFPRATLTAESVAVLADALADLPHDETLSAVRSLVRRMKFPPTVAEIREAVLDARLRLPTVAAAMADVVRARRTMAYDGAENRRFLHPLEEVTFAHPLVREAVREVGAARVVDDWKFAARDVEAAYVRLRADTLAAADAKSAGFPLPSVAPVVLAIADGADPYKRPALPDVGSGEVFTGWRWNDERGAWTGDVQDRDWARLGPWEHYLPGDTRKPRSGARCQRHEVRPAHLPALGDGHDADNHPDEEEIEA